MRSFIKRITPERLKRIYRDLRGMLLGAAFGLFGRFGIRQDRIVFENVWGYGDNPKSIARALRRLAPDLEIIFLTGGKKAHSGKRTAKKEIMTVTSGTFRAVYYLATARVWVDCNHKPYYVRKRAGQFYMQTWHGSLPLKRIEADAQGLSKDYLEEASYDTELADVFLSNSEFCSDIYRHAFGFRGRIAVTGSPRLDSLLRSCRRTEDGEKKRDGRRERILARLGIEPSQRVVLYAPTFRGGGEDAGPLKKLNAQEVCTALGERFGKDFVMAVRLHPLAVAHGCGVSSMTGPVTDASSFPDIYELLKVTDVLITDYSNIMFEFSYTGKPCFLFAPDSERYADDRGMYFVYDRLPFPIARNGEQLAKSIKSADLGLYLARAQAFYRELGIREDGHASVRAARIIMKEIGKEQKRG